MSLASKILERFRNRLKRVVEKERRICGCATSAMKRIARKIEMSPATLYRVVNGYGEVQVKAHQYMALLTYTLGSSKLAARFRNGRKASFFTSQQEA